MLGMRIALAALLVPVTAVMTLSAQADPQAEASPPLRRADESFLVQMRESLGDHAPAWPSIPSEKQEEWFREGLHRAASNNQPRRPPSPALGPDQPQPSMNNLSAPTAELEPPVGGNSWRTLLDAACELSRVADNLERQEFWDQAEPVREAAAGLRAQARRLAETPAQQPGGRSEYPAG